MSKLSRLMCCILAISLTLNLHAGFGALIKGGAKVAGHFSDDAAKVALKASGKKTLSVAARKAITKLTAQYGDDVVKVLAKGGVETLEQAAKHGDDFIKLCRPLTATQMKLVSKNAGKFTSLASRYGDDLIRVLKYGGSEAIEQSVKHGDDIVKACGKLNPAQIRAVMANSKILLPTIKKIGPKAFAKLERSPGITAKILSLYGDNGLMILKDKPMKEVIKVISFGEKANTPATKILFFNTYEKLGSKFIEKITPGTILATGLSAATITAAVKGINVAEQGMHRALDQDDRVTDAEIEIYKKDPKNNPLPRKNLNVIGDATTEASSAFKWVAIFGLALCAAWYFKNWRPRKKPDVPPTPSIPTPTTPTPTTPTPTLTPESKPEPTPAPQPTQPTQPTQPQPSSPNDPETSEVLDQEIICEEDSPKSDSPTPQL